MVNVIATVAVIFGAVLCGCMLGALFWDYLKYKDKEEDKE